MNQYVDTYGQWHVKTCLEGKPSSNDGLIISAYAKKAGLPVNQLEIGYMWTKLKGSYLFPIERTPGKPTPYPSRDFFLGARALSLTSVQAMETQNWNFSPFPLPPLNIFKLIGQLWKLRNKDRNYYWENPGFEQVYRTAFMVPFQDRAFYYAGSGEVVPRLYRAWNFVDSKLKTSNPSSALIKWLKHDIKPPKEIFVTYFGAQHPITLAVYP